MNEIPERPFTFAIELQQVKRTLYVSTTLLTTLLHSLCCVLPLLTTLLGASGAVPALAGLLPYQPYFWALQGLILLAAFYHVYSRPHRASSRRMIWGLALVSIFFSFVPHSNWFKDERQVLAQEQIQRVFNTRRLVLQVDTLTRPVAALEQELHALKGVLPTQTRLEAGRVSVRYDQQQTTRAAILGHLTGQGYRVRLVAVH
jgi:copper chaperone CopZ